MSRVEKKSLGTSVNDCFCLWQVGSYFDIKLTGISVKDISMWEKLVEFFTGITKKHLIQNLMVKIFNWN